MEIVHDDRSGCRGRCWFTFEVKYPSDVKSCSAIIVKFSACAESEMKEIPHDKQAFHMAKPYFTREAYFTNPATLLYLIIFPSGEMVTMCSGMSLPLFSMAVLTA